MIYTITFNPSLDYIMKTPGFEPGRVNRSTGELVMPGGKGINVSIVLKNLGTESTALGFVSGFTGDYIENSLKKESSKVLFSNGTKSIVSFTIQV